MEIERWYKDEWDIRTIYLDLKQTSSSLMKTADQKFAREKLKITTLIERALSHRHRASK